MVYELAHWEDTISTPSPASRPEYYFSGHCGSVCCVERSPFFRDILLSVGGWTFALWKEGAKVRKSRGKRSLLKWESVCGLCTVKERTRECWGDIRVRGTDVWPLYIGAGTLKWVHGGNVWFQDLEWFSWGFFQFEFISAPIHLSSLSRVMLCWSPVAPLFPLQEGRGLQPDQVRGEWLGCIGTEWSG